MWFKNIKSIHASKFFRRINKQETKSYKHIDFDKKKKNLKSNYQPLLNNKLWKRKIINSYSGKMITKF